VPKTRLPMALSMLSTVAVSVLLGGARPRRGGVRVHAETLRGEVAGLLAEKLASTTGRRSRASPAPKTSPARSAPHPVQAHGGRRQHPGRFRDGDLCQDGQINFDYKAERHGFPAAN